MKMGIVGRASAVAPFAVGIASLLRGPKPSSPIALVLIAVALAIAGWNAYGSFVRPRLGKPFESVIPMLGTLFALAAVATSFGARPLAAVALLVLLVDTGGWPWFVYTMWRRLTAGTARSK